MQLAQVGTPPPPPPPPPPGSGDPIPDRMFDRYRYDMIEDYAPKAKSWPSTRVPVGGTPARRTARPPSRQLVPVGEEPGNGARRFDFLRGTGIDATAGQGVQGSAANQGSAPRLRTYPRCSFRQVDSCTQSRGAAIVPPAPADAAATSRPEDSAPDRPQ